MERRMKSDQVRTNWRDVLDYVRGGGTVIVEHYYKTVATLAPPVTEPAIAMNEAELDLITEALIQLDYKLRDAMKATTNIAEKNRIRRRIEDIDAMNGRINDLEYRGEVTPPGYRGED